MTVYKITQIKVTIRILLFMFLPAMTIIEANGSLDKKSVLNQCQNMEDCPAGKICENYEDMKHSLDRMVQAEILLG